MDTLELINVMNKIFKDENGNVDHEQIEKTKKDLKTLGPFYREVLQEISKND